MTLVALGLTAPPAATALAAPQPAAPATAKPTGTVTLLTGDQVVVQAGKVSAVRPGPGRQRMPFTTRTGKDRIEVIPADAGQLVARNRLDRRLFDVAYLLREGYGDASRQDVPLLVSYQPGARTRGLTRARGAKLNRSLSTADALSAPKPQAGQFWSELAAEGDRGLAGVRKVWLDARVRANLDRSVAQIGAPTAWKAGLTGKGVTVAVLDTGIDAKHPDLKNVVSQQKDFTGTDPGASDEAGHGTHVASTIAGSGAAAGGKYKGVAPDARLAVGKVLAGGGVGQLSWILAGMEWAARDAKAKVVSMSLGGGNDAETDPLEEAVERLTKETGALFVVAAGNDGPGVDTIGSPASAPSSLAVGAVDKKDQLAEFSSRGGGAYGNYTPKPDLTAPGVGIVAARAAGTPAQHPVGEHYQAQNGTSMATPHVAGAAAILAQRHPEWKADQLKRALTSSVTALPKLGSFEQGTGRLDIARAIATKVTATTAADLGYLRWPHQNTRPAAKQVTWYNDGDQPVRLRLALTATGPKGEPARLFTVAAKEVTVPAKSTATAQVNLAHRGITPGNYSGHLTATDPDGTPVTRTTVTAYVEPESYDLTVKLLDRDGKAPDQNRMFNQVTVVNISTGESFGGLSGDTIRLPKGRYSLEGHVSSARPGRIEPRVAQLADPAYPLNSDSTATLDARTANRVSIDLDHPRARAQYIHLTMDHHTALNSQLTVPPEYEVYAGSARAGTGFVFTTSARYLEPVVRLEIEQPKRFALPVDAAWSFSEPMLFGTHRLTAVDVGAGRAEDLARVNLKDRLAVVTAEGQEPELAQRMAAIRAAGAKAVLIAMEGTTLELKPSLPTAFTTDPTVRELTGSVGKTTQLSWYGTEFSPYQYNLVLVHPREVPKSLAYQVRTADLARVPVEYRPVKGAAQAGLLIWREVLGHETSDFVWSTGVKLPSVRQEYFMPGLKYQHDVRFMSKTGEGLHEEKSEWRTFTKGENPRQFFGGK